MRDIFHADNPASSDQIPLFFLPSFHPSRTCFIYCVNMPSLSSLKEILSSQIMLWGGVMEDFFHFL